jgi:hypothetical protein
MLGDVGRRAIVAGLAAGACAVVAAGCGGGGGTVTVEVNHPPTVTGKRSTPPKPVVPQAGATRAPAAADLAVVRRWADAVRAGDVATADAQFHVPAVIANGGPPIRVREREGIRVFDETLPCGAKVVSAKGAPGGFFVVTFLLTDRAGSHNCGTGVGQLARTAIRVRDGHITDWVRVQDLPRGPSVSA